MGGGKDRRNSAHGFHCKHLPTTSHYCLFLRLWWVARACQICHEPLDMHIECVMRPTIYRDPAISTRIANLVGRPRLSNLSRTPGYAYRVCREHLSIQRSFAISTRIIKSQSSDLSRTPEFTLEVQHAPRNIHRYPAILTRIARSQRSHLSRTPGYYVCVFCVCVCVCVCVCI